ncbi:hypothetical protein RXV86_00385 [Alisedimentitalea sp. MJ-SS2]|uniref:hypothetical protein n=1 Tax=Aliisedimentitalea sp. MJ-SS2 TaxID=3049795 RepID=UPI00290E472A|nr:hypothetical protein [Alisedimentitalea sp. MJ-SS2]MDU8925833.1 hypothetical protein [Alisedimentitalea sp. MJ-SS2]
MSLLFAVLRRLRGLKRATMFFGAGAVMLTLSACSDTGPVYLTAEALQAWVRTPGAVDPRSDRAPAVSEDAVRFALSRGQRRSMLRTGNEWLVGQSYLFGFDVRADRKQLGNRPVVISRLMRKSDPTRVLAEVRLDARNGVTVMGRSCIPANALGTWHQVEMRIRLADDDTGFFEVFCDRKPVWAQSELRTTQPPICRRSAGCNQPVAKPVAFEWQFGLLAVGRATRAVQVEMQRVFYHRLFVIPNRVGRL